MSVENHTPAPGKQKDSPPPDAVSGPRDGKDERQERAWDDLGNTLREMSRGDDLGPLGELNWRNTQ